MSRSRTRERVALSAPAEIAVESDAPAASPAGTARPRALPHALRAGAPTWIWMGMGVCVLGFILIAVAWGQVAAETQVHLQLPYVVSAALVGLGLVIVGLTVLDVATRQRDVLDHDRQIAQLINIMEEIRETLADRGRR